MGLLKEKIVKKINKAISDSRYSIRQFSQEVGISETTIHKILKGKQDVKLDTLEVIAETLGKSMSYFFDDGITAIIDKDINENYQEISKLQKQIESLEIQVDHLKNRNMVSKDAFDVIMNLIQENENVPCSKILPLLKEDNSIIFMKKYGLLNHKLFQ